ncbi:uncharacterized protein BXZ73DRAFT_74471 [Epithele typhae]|uniref:uncharacterized protein n=1 Tax=Epithele typhae TaxID=378194 RepID=UPI002008E043|nr:uncharacterized protein BXZ73DRAFT_74471 [Epithele typhae]KAH9942161.1 hypothetical protein BXZ73DRAFT_74471 [Epithele typhae]
MNDHFDNLIVDDVVTTTIDSRPPIPCNTTYNLASTVPTIASSAIATSAIATSVIASSAPVGPTAAIPTLTATAIVLQSSSATHHDIRPYMVVLGAVVAVAFCMAAMLQWRSRRNSRRSQQPDVENQLPQNIQSSPRESIILTLGSDSSDSAKLDEQDESSNEDSPAAFTPSPTSSTCSLESTATVTSSTFSLESTTIGTLPTSALGSATTGALSPRAHPYGAAGGPVIVLSQVRELNKAQRPWASDPELHTQAARGTSPELPPLQFPAPLVLSFNTREDAARWSRATRWSAPKAFNSAGNITLHAMRTPLTSTIEYGTSEFCTRRQFKDSAGAVIRAAGPRHCPHSTLKRAATAPCSTWMGRRISPDVAITEVSIRLRKSTMHKSREGFVDPHALQSMVPESAAAQRVSDDLAIVVADIYARKVKRLQAIAQGLTGSEYLTRRGRKKNGVGVAMKRGCHAEAVPWTRKLQRSSLDGRRRWR